VLVEIGGTVGDIESFPFLESIRQVRQELGSSRVLNIHLTLVPSLSVAGEMKTKPTQHSVKELMQIGILPDILLCRSNRQLSDEMRSKIALFCNVLEKNVIAALDSNSIYDIPEMLHENGYDDIVLSHFSLRPKKLDIQEWNSFVKSFHKPKTKVTIGVIGKYITLQDAYKSIYEALIHGATANHAELTIEKIDPEEFEKKPSAIKSLLQKVDGILVPGGFGTRGIEGKIQTISYARKEKKPFFGICLGLHCAVIEFSRNECGLKDATSKEFDPEAEDAVISFLEDQEVILDKGGTMRLGAYACKLQDNTKIRSIYKKSLIHERHRHRLEFTLKYKQLLEEHGMVFAGIHPKTNLVETIELKDHPWFIATQYHPEFKSKPTKVHPLFKDFVRAAIDEGKRKK
jgi:CTP synthase